MSEIKAGTVVRVIKGADKNLYHAFAEGTEVVATGESYTSKGDRNFGKQVTQFRGDFQSGGHNTQYLYDDYFEVIGEDKPKPVEIVVDTKLPSKVVYGILNKQNEVIATTADREYARELKSALGGKRSGIVIVQFKAHKEIR